RVRADRRRAGRREGWRHSGVEDAALDRPACPSQAGTPPSPPPSPPPPAPRPPPPRASGLAPSRGPRDASPPRPRARPHPAFGAAERGSLTSRADDQVPDRMRTSIRAANGAIFQRTLTEHDKRGMGTTVTALVLYDTRFLIGQVGDSRAYLYRDQKLMQLTKDHSYVQEQVDAGYLTPEQARSHPYSNVITRCVGANSDVMPDVYLGTVKPRDLF